MVFFKSGAIVGTTSGCVGPSPIDWGGIGATQYSYAFVIALSLSRADATVLTQPCC